MEFLKITEADLEQILTWRTSEFVTRYMFTDVEYNLENQKKWFEKVSNDNRNLYWMIASKGRKIGLVSLNDIDWHHKRASWAFYVGEEKYGMIAGMIGPHVYNYAFDTLGFHKLTGEVMAENENVRKMHLKHGCREVGHFKDHILKYGKYQDVYLFEMLASTWEEHREKYKKCVPLVER